MRKTRWTREHLDPLVRKKSVMGAIRHHRDPRGYRKGRGLKDLEEALPLVKSHIINAPKQVQILLPGPGHYQLAEELKHRFGNKVHLTSVDLVKPRVRKGMLKLFTRALRGTQRKETRTLISQNFSGILNANKRMKNIDDLNWGFMEDHEAKNEFGIVIDLYGPLTYSHATDKVAENYLDALKEGGLLVTDTKHIVLGRGIGRVIPDGIPKESAYCLKPISSGAIYVFQKVKNPSHKK